MNWLDLVLIALVVVGAFLGMRVGLIGAAFTAAGIIIGWLLAGQLSDDVGGWFDKSLSNDTAITVIAYVIIIALAIIVAKVVEKIVRPMLTVATVGMSVMVDKLGGLALGVLFGLIISGALIIAMARLAYNFEFPEEGIAGRAAERIDVLETKERVEDALIESAIVPVFVDVTDAVPASALGFVPSDFKLSLDILEQNIDAAEIEEEEGPF